MAIKKKPKPKPLKPYDPYSPYGNHSLTWYQQQANQRAAQDTSAQVAALPSSQFYTDSASQLAKALAGIQQNQAGIAGAGGGLYQQAFQNASAPASRAAMVAGGQPLAGPANTSLVGALGATMAQAFAGGQDAAVARGRNDVLARAGQETAIRAKQPSAAANYLKEMTDNALQARVARFNEQLANSQFGLDASNTAFDNQLNAAQLDASIAGDQASAGAKSQASINKARGAARRAAEEIRKGTKSSVNIGNDYTFNVPNSIISDDPAASGTTKHVIRAKDGPNALSGMNDWLRSLPNYDAATMNPRTFYSGQFTPITQDKTTPGSRTAQLHAALDVLMNDYGIPRAQALQYAREIIGSRKLIKRKKKSNRDPNAGGK